jgi:hypothetical protein
MTRKRKFGRRVDATGRSIGSGYRARFHRWEVMTPAFRSLSIGARALLLELKMLYTGNNNGALFLSAREAATRGGGAATTWILTEFAHGNALTTKDFIHWQPIKPAPKPITKNHSAVPPAVQPVPLSGTVPFKTCLTIPATGTVAPFIGLQRYHQRCTDNIPREAEPLSCRATAALPEAVAA